MMQMRNWNFTTKIVFKYHTPCKCKRKNSIEQWAEKFCVNFGTASLFSLAVLLSNERIIHHDQTLENLCWLCIFRASSHSHNHFHSSPARMPFSFISMEKLENQFSFCKLGKKKKWNKKKESSQNSQENLKLGLQPYTHCKAPQGEEMCGKSGGTKRFKVWGKFMSFHFCKQQQSVAVTGTEWGMSVELDMRMCA